MEISNKENNFISAVVYCYNDADNMKSFLDGLVKTLSATFLKYEIIVVNDYSTDKSADVVKEYAAHKEDLVISLLNMSYFQGIEASMNAGVNLSIGDFVYEFDSINVDYDWDMLIKVYRHSLTGYDIVSAKANRKPKFISRIFYKVFNRYAKLQYTVSTETFRILSRRAINRIHSITLNIPFRKAAYANSGLDLDVLTYTPIRSIIRKKQIDSGTVAMDALILYTDVAYRITVGLSLVMFCASLGFAIYAIVYKLLESPVEGWTTTVVFTCVGFSGLFIILAMVIKYLQILVQFAFKKKDFVFESIQKLQ